MTREYVVEVETPYDPGPCGRQPQLSERLVRAYTAADAVTQTELALERTGYYSRGTLYRARVVGVRPSDSNPEGT